MWKEYVRGTMRRNQKTEKLNVKDSIAEAACCFFIVPYFLISEFSLFFSHLMWKCLKSGQKAGSVY